MWTDGHNEANSRFSQFCKRAEKLDYQSDAVKNDTMAVPAEKNPTTWKTKGYGSQRNMETSNL